jgi:hypothetical protein
MWASDYPHPTARSPLARAIAEAFAIDPAFTEQVKAGYSASTGSR